MNENINRLKNNLDISLKGFISNYPIKEISQQGNSFIILGESDHLWAYIWSNSKNELIKLIETYDYKTRYFASIKDWEKSVIKKYNNVEWELTTKRFILPENIEVNCPKNKVLKLQPDDADYIYNNSNYKEVTSTGYIKERIQNGVSAGIIKNNKLVAWGLTHDDNALGFLHVIKTYRKQGLAIDITKSLVNQLKRESKPVFVNIESDNFKSIGLAEKIGFCFDKNISWLKVK